MTLTDRARQLAIERCEANPVSSRVCERGTRCCTVYHRKAIEAAFREAITAALAAVQQDMQRQIDERDANRDAYYAKACDLLADTLQTLEPEQLEGRRPKLVAIARAAANEVAAVQQEQRLADRPWMQHKASCLSRFCYKCVGQDYGPENYVHRERDNAFFHEFKSRGCTCGLDAHLTAGEPT